MSLGERLSKHVLAVYPNSRGFGFVVFEDPKSIVEWGLPQVRPPDQSEILALVNSLLDRHQPDVLVIESTDDPECRRKDRVRSLLKAVARLGARSRIPVQTVFKEAIGRAFAHADADTKHKIATVIASQYPELAPRLPPKRDPWDSEDERMSLFSAAALAIAFYFDET